MRNVTSASDMQSPGHPLLSHMRMTPGQLRQFDCLGITLRTRFQYVQVQVDLVGTVAEKTAILHSLLSAR